MWADHTAKGDYLHYVAMHGLKMSEILLSSETRLAHSQAETMQDIYRGHRRKYSFTELCCCKKGRGCFILYGVKQIVIYRRNFGFCDPPPWLLDFTIPMHFVQMGTVEILLVLQSFQVTTDDVFFFLNCLILC